MLPPPSQRAPRHREQQRVLVHRHAHAAAPTLREAVDAEHAAELPPLRAKTIGAQLTLRSPVRARCRLVAATALDEEARRVGVSSAAIASALDVCDRQVAGMRAGGCPIEAGELVLVVPCVLSVAVIGRLLRERLAVDPPADPALAARMTAAAALLV